MIIVKEAKAHSEHQKDSPHGGKWITLEQAIKDILIYVPQDKFIDIKFDNGVALVIYKE